MLRLAILAIMAAMLAGCTTCDDPGVVFRSPIALGIPPAPVVAYPAAPACAPVGYAPAPCAPRITREK
jgi:hypothetical protein